MKRIVVVAEGRFGSRLADAAVELAGALEAGVTVVAADGVEVGRLAPAPPGELLADARRRAEAMAQLLAAAGVEAELDVREGMTADSVIAAAQELDAAVLVVSASDRPQIAERLLGSLPLDLIRRSDRQVLVVADGG